MSDFHVLRLRQKRLDMYYQLLEDPVNRPLCMRIDTVSMHLYNLTGNQIYVAGIGKHKL